MSGGNAAGGNTGGPMDYEYDGPQSHLPLATPSAAAPPNSGSRCPARATWGAQAGAGGLYSNPYGSWNPHVHPAGALVYQHRPAPLHWPLRAPTHQTGGPPSRPPESSHNQDTDLRSSASPFPNPTAQTSAPNTSETTLAAQHPSATASESPPPRAVPPQPIHASPVGSAENDVQMRDAGSSSGLGAFRNPPSQSEAPARRGVLDSPSPSVVRVRLPAPSDHRPRQRYSSNQPDRLSHSGGPSGSSGGNGGRASTSPIWSADDYGDSLTARRMARTLGHAYGHSSRQSQIIRGQMSNKRVATKWAIQSLLEVDTDSLEDSDKTCTICYNTFGVASPEGIVETPLRLPKCKHIFGDKCVLKWLAESSSCPYCRDELDSEPAGPDSRFMHRFLEAAGSDPQLLAQTAALRRLIGERTYVQQAYVTDRANASTHRLRDHEAGRDMSARERRAMSSASPGDSESRLRAPQEVSYESPNGTATRHSPPAPTVQPQSLGHQPSSYRPPVWPQSRHVQPPPFVEPQMTPSPNYTPHASAGALQPSTPQSLTNQFTPLPPPTLNQMSTNQFPPMQSRDYYLGPGSYAPNGSYASIMPYFGSPLPFAFSSQEPNTSVASSTLAQHPPHLASFSGQLPAFPELFPQGSSYAAQAEHYSAPAHTPYPANFRTDGGSNDHPHYGQRRF